MYDLVAASWAGGSSSNAVAGLNQYGLPFAAWDQGTANGCGWGGRWDMDGNDCGGFIWCAIGEFLDCEQYEVQYPIVHLFRNRYVPDRSGPGKFRGGRTISSCQVGHG